MDEPRILRPDGAAVAAARENAGLTKYRLAKVLGRSRSTITDIESGRRNTTAPLLEAIADVCGVPVSTLKATDEPRGETAPPAAQGMQLRDQERAQPDNVPELRGADLGGK